MRYIWPQKKPADLPLVNEADSESQPLLTKQPSYLTSCLTAASTRMLHISGKGAQYLGYYTGRASFQILDFLRITLVTQTLSGRWLFELFRQLDRYDLAPEKSIQKTWLGWPIIAGAALAALSTKTINALKKEEYPAAQDFVFAAFSSSVVYMILDLLSETGTVEEIPLWGFIVTSIALPLAGFAASKLTIQDSTNKVIVKPSEFKNAHNFPAYPDAPTKEKVINIFGGVGLGACLSIFFWTLNREMNSKTVSMDPRQIAASAVASSLYATLGYYMTDHPKVFNSFAALSKATKDGSLAYAALSGMAFHSLMQIFECSGEVCWEQSLNETLTIPFSMLATAVGLFSAATTLYRFQKNHEANEQLFKTLTDVKNKMISCFGGTKNALSSCSSSVFNSVSNLSKSCCSSKKGEEEGYVSLP